MMRWKGGLSSAPSSPEQGWAYYNTTDGISYIWDGKSWEVLARDGTDGFGSGGGTSQGPWLYITLSTKSGNYVQANSTTFETVDFGKSAIDSTSRSTSFIIGITGGDPTTTLNLTGSPTIQISGTDSNCFFITQPSNTSTTQGTYIMDASIAFTPDSLGEKTATITIPNNSPDKPDFSFTVTGRGSLWPKVFDGGEGDGEDMPVVSLMDNAGNLYFVGYGYELVSDYSGRDWWIKKFDSLANEITSGWNKQIDVNQATYYDQPTDAVLDSNGNLYITSTYNDTTKKIQPDGTEITGSYNSYDGILSTDHQDNLFIVSNNDIYRFNNSGTRTMSKSLVNDYKAQSATSDDEGNVYIAGHYDNLVNSYSQEDGFIKKFNSTGSTEITTGWNKIIDGGHSDPDYITEIRFDGTNIIVVGHGKDLISGSSKDDGWIRVYSKDGTELTYFVIEEEEPELLRIDSDGNYWFSSGTSTDAAITKYDASGIQIAKYAYNTASPYIRYPSVVMDDQNNIYIAGSASNLVTAKSGYDWIIMKLDSNGVEY